MLIFQTISTILVEDCSFFYIILYIVPIRKCLIFSFCVSELEWMLGQIGAVNTDIKERPREETKDMLYAAVRCNTIGQDSDSD